MEELKRVKYSPAEIENITAETPNGFNAVTKINTPITPRDNYAAAMDHKLPLWIPCCTDSKIFLPHVNPDHLCRGLPFCSAEGQKPGESLDAEDIFGVPFIFVPTVGGCIEDPSKPHRLNDISEWESELTFPDPDTWDWKGSGERNKEYLSGGYYNILWQCSGLRERLTALVGFENSLLALIDEDSKPYIHSFFERLVEYYKKVIRNCAEVYNIDMLFFHDDWGTQISSIVSPDTTREMIAPYLKEIIDYTHKCGLKFQMHSCGCNMENVEIMIECGADVYSPQANANDVDELYRRYSDQIILGIWPDINPNATDSEVRDFAKKFADKYCPDYTKRTVYLDDAMFAPLPKNIKEYIYEETRMAFNP